MCFIFQVIRNKCLALFLSTHFIFTGLIVKQILTEAMDSKDEKIQSLLKETAGLIFYSVPHMGSELATKMNSASILLQLSNDIAELKKGIIFSVYNGSHKVYISGVH